MLKNTKPEAKIPKPQTPKSESINPLALSTVTHSSLLPLLPPLYITGGMPLPVGPLLRSITLTSSESSGEASGVPPSSTTRFESLRLEYYPSTLYAGSAASGYNPTPHHPAP